jgi:hypothetical protein
MSGHGAEPEVPHDEHDPFVKKVALSVAIFAVILAVAGMGGKNASKDMMSAQMDASNTFAWYQAKSQKEVMYTQKKESLEEADKLSEQQKQRLDLVTKKLAEYEKEKADLKQQGDDFTAKRTLNHRKDGYFDIAELFLQLAIVLASISMLSKARWPWTISLLLAVVGLLLTLNGYFLVVSVPGIDAAAHGAGGH